MKARGQNVLYDKEGNDLDMLLPTISELSDGATCHIVEKLTNKAHIPYANLERHLINFKWLGESNSVLFTTLSERISKILELPQAMFDEHCQRWLNTLKFRWRHYVAPTRISQPWKPEAASLDVLQSKTCNVLTRCAQRRESHQ